MTLRKGKNLAPEEERCHIKKHDYLRKVTRNT